MEEEIIRAVRASIAVKESLLRDGPLVAKISEVTGIMTNALKDGKKVLFCGNGGSAADAQHLAAELSGRFYFDRKPLYAEALHVNTSYLTAVANDYSYDEVFSRLVEGKGQRGDVLVGISTSGNSKNIIRAFETANRMGVVTVALTGESGGKMKDYCKYLLNVPSTDTPRIQESHILIGHIICELIESAMFGQKG